MYSIPPSPRSLYSILTALFPLCPSLLSSSPSLPSSPSPRPSYVRIKYDCNLDTQVNASDCTPTLQFFRVDLTVKDSLKMGTAIQTRTASDTVKAAALGVDIEAGADAGTGFSFVDVQVRDMPGKEAGKFTQNRVLREVYGYRFIFDVVGQTRRFDAVNFSFSLSMGLAMISVAWLTVEQIRMQCERRYSTDKPPQLDPPGTHLHVDSIDDAFGHAGMNGFEGEGMPLIVPDAIVEREAPVEAEADLFSFSNPMRKEAAGGTEGKELETKAGGAEEEDAFSMENPMNA